MLFFRHPDWALRHGGVLAAAIACWSPFSVIGLAPIVIYAIATTGFKPAWSASNFIAGPLLLAPAWIFLTQDAGDLPVGLVWQSSAFTVERFALFILLEVGLVATALVFAVPRYFSAVVFCTTFLAALAFVRLGLGNDLLMRGGIPSLAVIGVLAAEAALTPSMRSLPLIACLVVGAVTPAGELARAFKFRRIDNSAAIEMHDVLKGIHPDVWRQYGVSAGK
jgi:hypothetical protein